MFRRRGANVDGPVRPRMAHQRSETRCSLGNFLKTMAEEGRDSHSADVRRIDVRRRVDALAAFALLQRGRRIDHRHGVRARILQRSGYRTGWIGWNRLKLSFLGFDRWNTNLSIKYTIERPSYALLVNIRCSDRFRMFRSASLNALTSAIRASAVFSRTKQSNVATADVGRLETAKTHRVSRPLS